MSDLRTAAQQALEAWDQPHGINYVDFRPYMDALRAALAESEKLSEPVAWMHTNGVGHVYFRKKPQDKVFNPRPVYLKNE